MTKEEFLALFGKGTEDENTKLIAALEEDPEEGWHSDFKEEMTELFNSDPDAAWLGLMGAMLAVNAPEGTLEHYGIEGQKWGVRNGPPYPLERKHGFHRIPNKNKAKIMLDNLDDLSLQEIRDLVSRMELEDKLVNIAYPPKKDSFAKKMLKEGGKAVLSTVVPAATTYAFKQIINQVGGPNMVAEMFPNKKK